MKDSISRRSFISSTNIIKLCHNIQNVRNLSIFRKRKSIKSNKINGINNNLSIIMCRVVEFNRNCKSSGNNMVCSAIISFIYILKFHFLCARYSSIFNISNIPKYYIIMFLIMTDAAYINKALFIRYSLCIVYNWHSILIDCHT